MNRALTSWSVSLALHGVLLLCLWALMRPSPMPRWVSAPSQLTKNVTRISVALRETSASAGAINPTKRKMSPRAKAVTTETQTGSVGEVAEVAAPVEAAQVPGELASSSAVGIDVTRLHAQLSEAALHCYPPGAQRLGISGEATVQFCFKQASRVEWVKVEKTSGYGMLDEAAETCVVPRAFPVEAPAGCYTVPIRFQAP